MRMTKKNSKVPKSANTQQRYQRFLNDARAYNWQALHIKAAQQTGNAEHEAFYPITSLLTIPSADRETFICAVEEAAEENHVEVITDDSYIYAVADPCETTNARA